MTTTETLFRSDRLTAGHVATAAVLAGLGALVTRDAWAEIFSIAWRNEEYSHILLVPIVAAWMVLVRQKRARHCTPTGTMAGALTVAAGWAISSFGFYNQYESLWHLGAILVVSGCVVSILGIGVVFRFAPAFIVLVFLIPIPGRIRTEMTLPLQRVTAVASQYCFELMSIPTELRGNTLAINGHPVQIHEACNGMRMVFALILVSFAFAFGTQLRNSVRLLIMCLSPVAALVCNVVRTVPTIYLYGYASQPTADAFHEYAGWAMLPVAFGMLYGILKLLRWALIPVSPYTLATQ